MPTSPPGLKYIKELDVVRAIAIISVLFNHWFPLGSLAYKISSTISAPDIFFTLSGFLITKILLAERTRAEKLKINKVNVFANFFIKRALRTMPAYYLVIVLTYFISGEPKEYFYPYIFFFANLHQYYTESWGPMAHLWTMAVEQQFYFIWPWFILYMPRKYLLPTIMAIIGAGLAFQHILPLTEFSFVHPLTCFDALGIGGLLAWFYENHKAKIPLLYRWLMATSIAVILIMIAQTFFYLPLIIFTRTMVSLVTATIILYFVVNTNHNKPLNRIFWENKFLLTTGRISYGIYLYHLMLFSYGHKWFLPFVTLLPFTLSSTGRFILYVVVNFAILFLIAFLSWKYFEQPLSNLKKYFNTTPKKPGVPLVYEKVG